MSVQMTLPTDSAARKEVPLLSGCLRYFPAALAGVAKRSHEGNQKHNPGQPMHHAREKSGDHGDTIVRHLVDLQDCLAAGNELEALREADAICWRALALSQELHERFGGAPLAPGARTTTLPRDCREWDERRERDQP
jgi:hypothetical protein